MLRLSLFAAATVAGTPSFGASPEEDHAASYDGFAGYAAVNGLRMYYEVHGAGRPLVLLHGGLETIDRQWLDLIPVLAATRKVIAVELQGHGHTADIDRPLRYETMADDVAALIRRLGRGAADVFGFSMGGGVALQIAIRHPDVVRRLVVASAPMSSDGWHPEVRAAIAANAADEVRDSPWHEAYVRAAPDPYAWPSLVARVGRMVGAEPYDWSRAVAAIRTPVLLLVGDADSVRLPHVVEMFALLGGGRADGDMRGFPASRLVVLPGTTHLSLLQRTDLLVPIIRDFLDAAQADFGAHEIDC